MAKVVLVISSLLLECSNGNSFSCFFTRSEKLCPLELCEQRGHVLGKKKNQGKEGKYLVKK
uniref:Secreted protein n=1 Tax=Rhizophora mucronata TaxID=61149 RepID=A0A2P2NWR8_RHIMU